MRVAVVIIGTAFVSTTVAMTFPFLKLRQCVRSRCEILGKLINCPYCLGTWLSMGVIAFLSPILSLQWWEYIFAWAALAGSQAIVSGLLCWAMCCMLNLSERE